MKKPNAIKHMIAYGFIYGLLLGMIYVWGFLIFVGDSFVDTGSIIFTLWISALFGGLPGAALGFLDGVMIWFFTRKIQQPLDREAFAVSSRRSYKAVVALTTLGMSAIWLMLFGAFFFEPEAWFIYLPILVASATSVYATRRYLMKLAAWGQGGERKQKPRKNHYERLTESTEEGFLDGNLYRNEAQQHDTIK